MLAKAPRHSKMIALGDALGEFLKLDIDLCHTLAIGIMERLWIYASEFVQQGDIGKLSNARLAKEVGWNQEADWLVNTLEQIQWIDPHPNHRYIIHDWPDHCQDSVHLSLARKHLYFADGSRPKLTRLSKEERIKILIEYEQIEKNLNYSQSTEIQEALCVRTESAQIDDLCAQEEVLCAQEAHFSGVKSALPSLALPSLALPNPALPSQAPADCFNHTQKPRRLGIAENALDFTQFEEPELIKKLFEFCRPKVFSVMQFIDSVDTCQTRFSKSIWVEGFKKCLRYGNACTCATIVSTCEDVAKTYGEKLSLEGAELIPKTEQPKQNTRHDPALWNQIKKFLCKEISQGEFYDWFDEALVWMRENTFVFGLPNQYRMGYISKNHRETLVEIIKKIKGNQINEVEFVVTGSLGNYPERVAQ